MREVKLSAKLNGTSLNKMAIYNAHNRIHDYVTMATKREQSSGSFLDLYLYWYRFTIKSGLKKGYNFCPNTG
jgi:hypothetical protein